MAGKFRFLKYYSLQLLYSIWTKMLHTYAINKNYKSRCLTVSFCVFISPETTKWYEPFRFCDSAKIVATSRIVTTVFTQVIRFGWQRRGFSSEKRQSFYRTRAVLASRVMRSSKLGSAAALGVHGLNQSGLRPSTLILLIRTRHFIRACAVRLIMREPGSETGRGGSRNNGYAHRDWFPRAIFFFFFFNAHRSQSCYLEQLFSPDFFVHTRRIPKQRNREKEKN